jgi:riboflavin synthase
MFTGIVEELGTVRASGEGELSVGASKVLWGTNPGDSISVNGVDLTAKMFDEEGVVFNVMPETLRRSNLGDLKPGDIVNLERSLTLAQRISGHLVRGVVEGTATLDSFTPEGEAIIARFNTPPELLRYIVMKGPVAIDGISLTVMAKDEGSFSVSIVQYTQEHTNLGGREAGDRVNIETDILARYVEAVLTNRDEAGLKLI